MIFNSNHIQRSLLAFSLTALIASRAFALAPHQIVLLVNAESPDSIEVANHYRNIRNIPHHHVIFLETIPDASIRSPYRISLRDFRRHILEPVNQTISERGLGRILAWVYSTDFPVTVHARRIHDISLHGATFIRGEPPEPESIRTGQYVSPLFGGPHPGSGNLDNAATFDRLMAGSDIDHPIPSMSLGFSGSHGNTIDTILACLRTGALADSTRPPGTVYFVENEGDPRSDCRRWQYEPTRNILQQHNLDTVITNQRPVDRPAIIGLMDGRPHVRPQEAGRFLPGAMAEHLTSLAAKFDTDDQSKCTHWIAAGATASAGTVTEPYAIWTKFPAATFFHYYAQGCSIMESFYLSVRSPLQLYMIGEPLAAPWRRPISITLIALDDEPLSGHATFHARLFPSPPPGANIRYHALLNDRPLAAPVSGPNIRLDTTQLPDGHNRLRVVAEFGALVTFSASAEIGFLVNNQGHSVTLGGIGQRSDVAYEDPLQLRITHAGEPGTIGLVSGPRQLATQPAKTSATSIQIDPAALGAGPVLLQAFADYPDAPRVLSKPLLFTIARPDTHAEYSQPHAPDQPVN